MSNALAIATVTATLRNLIIRGVPDLPNENVTTKPPDKARNGNNPTNQINLFLYQVSPNAAWRNMNLPNQVKPGESGQPPLALNLYYLVTAYGANDDDIFSHHWLGEVMSTFHDHPLLGADEIRDALLGNDLYQQLERVRITPQPMSSEEMSKLWTTFQTQYRVSAAYEVAVVLIESTRPVKTPLPVLRRGSKDEGVKVQPDLLPPFPTLEAVLLPNQQSSAALGDIITIRGHHLDGNSVKVELRNPRLTAAKELTPEPGRTATEITIKLPEPGDPIDPASPTSTWLAGLYTLAVVISRTDEPDRITNELPFSLAPRITVIPNAAAAGDVALTLTCQPKVQREQRVSLLFGDREIPAAPEPRPTQTLNFLVKNVTPGDYFVRLRVDGIDSLLLVNIGTPPQLEFNPALKVAIA